MSKIDALVLLADPHCGSPYGVMPPEFRDDHGNGYTANPLQEWYWQCLNDGLRWVKHVLRRREWGLVLNGDLIEGVHHGGKEVVSQQLAMHVGMAVHTFRPWADAAARTWVIEGTECHTQGNESVIGEKLKAMPFKSALNGLSSYAWPELPITVNGCYGIIRHHITTSIRPWTEATGLGSQLNSERIEHTRSGKQPPKWCVYAHRHKYGAFSDGDGAVWTLSPWQGLTRYGRKVVGHARFTKPSILILDFRDIEDEGLPVARRRVYGPEAMEAVDAQA